MMTEDRELDRLLLAYHRAESNLRAYLAALYPPNTHIQCRQTGNHYTVRAGSLHADQLYTNIGHVGVTHIERIE